MSVRRLLLVFAKEPRPGMAKTRLAAGIGRDSADALYRAFLADTARRANQVHRRIGVHVRWVCTPSARDFRVALELLVPGAMSDASLVAYPEEGLAAQQGDQLRWAEAESFSQVLITGTDTPHVDAGVLVDAFGQLDDTDVVLGPAADGGYYMLGLRAGWDLAATLDMRSTTVLDDVIGAARHRGLSVGLAPVATDIDTADDLRGLLVQGVLLPEKSPATCRVVSDLMAAGVVNVEA